jgi:hypothetical protein
MLKKQTSATHHVKMHRYVYGPQSSSRLKCKIQIHVFYSVQQNFRSYTQNLNCVVQLVDNNRKMF